MTRPAAAPRYLRDLDLAARYGVSRTTIWRWARSGLLPAPHAIGPSTTRWDAAEIARHDAELAGTHRSAV